MVRLTGEFNDPQLNHYSESIGHGQKLQQEEKIQFGKLIGKMEEDSFTKTCQETLSLLSTRLDNYLAEKRAENYIKATEDYFDDILDSSFGFEPIHHKRDIGSTEEEKKFMATCLEGVKERLILSKRFPLFTQGMDQLKNNYQKWKDLPNGSEKNELKQLMKQQHENLRKLSTLLDELCRGQGETKKERDDDASARSHALMQLAFVDATANPNPKIASGKLPPVVQHKITVQENLKDQLSPFFAGEKSLDEEALNTLRIDLEKAQQAILKQQPSTTEQLKKQREESPITKIAIEKQAKVFDVERTAKKWAEKQETLSRYGETANIVVQVKDQEIKDPEKQTVAIYKEGSGKEKAVGSMERLMWDMAVIMKMEGSFASTKETQLETIKDLHEGGIQVAVPGKTLRQYIDGYNSSLSRDQVTQGMLTSVAFGMFDAHHKNILVDDKGCHFFDNTLSMPHSNGFIMWGDNVRGAFRYGLLELPQSYEKLQPEELKNIKDELAIYQQKYEKLKAFLESKQVKKQIAQLPPGWMNAELALKAMKERLDRLEKGLAAGKIQCLRDIAFAVNPEMKFMAMLNFATLAKARKKLNIGDTDRLEMYQQMLLPEVGYHFLGPALDACIVTGLDPQKLLDLCNDPNLSFEDLMCKVSAYAHEGEKLKKPEEIKASANKILDDFKKQAEIDFKDISRNHCNYYLMKATLDKQNIPFIAYASIQKIETISEVQSLTPGNTITVYDASKDVVFKITKDKITSDIIIEELKYHGSPWNKN